MPFHGGAGPESPWGFREEDAGGRAGLAGGMEGTWDEGGWHLTSLIDSVSLSHL